MIIFCDGASNPKTKRSGIGAVWFNEDQFMNPFDGRSLKSGSTPQLVLSKEIVGGKTKWGYPTNNEAEYEALIQSLELSIDKGIPDVIVYMDSKLVVNQVNGLWKINFHHLQELKNKVDSLRDKIKFMVIHVRREYNTHADKQSKDCIST